MVHEIIATKKKNKGVWAWGGIQLAKKFGVDKNTIDSIVNGRTWNHVTGIKKGSKHA
jgi:plasmid maintenance system antidote protein VapI